MNRFFKGFLSAATALSMLSSVIPAFGADAEKVVAEPEYQGQPKYLIDQQAGSAIHHLDQGVVKISGWDVDQRGGNLVADFETYTQLIDVDDKYCVSIERNFDTLTRGKFTYETDLTFLEVGDDGWYTRIFDPETGKDALFITTEKRNLCYRDKNGKNQKIMPLSDGALYTMKAIFDMDAKNIELSINGKLFGTIDFADDVESVGKVKISTPEKGVMEFQYTYVRLYINHIVYDKFLNTDVKEGNLSYEWTVDSLDPSAIRVAENGYPSDMYALEIKDTNKTNKVIATRKFDAYSGPFLYEFKVLFPKAVNGAEFILGSKESPVLSMKTQGANMYLGDGRLLKKYTENVWQTYRIEGDTNTKKFNIYQNGKEVLRDYPFENGADFIDNFVIKTKRTASSHFWFDDLFIKLNPQYNDYPEEPIVDQSDDYAVGIMGCNLWRNGYHGGWDTISSHPDNIPLMGFYDEGVTEVSEWEYKWMAEHGVDYYMPCWYFPERYRGGPFKPYDASSWAAINDGYLNSKNSKYVKLSIMYNAGPGQFSKDDASTARDEWRNVVIPFWVDYYLSDERYMAVDNKAVFGFYAVEDLIKIFGGPEATKVEMDYLRQVCVDLGYDGAIFIGFVDLNSPERMANVKAAGMDMGTIYSHGPQSYVPGFQQSELEVAWSNKDSLTPLPVLSMGYSPYAWHQEIKYPFVTPELYEDVATFIRDEYLTRHEEGSFESKMVLLDNWNEIGEGHFLMPTQKYEFQLLDVLRRVWSNMPEEHTDLVPTENQKERLRGMYPKDRTQIRRDPPPFNEVNDVPEKVYYRMDMSNPDDAAKWRAERSVENVRWEDGLLKGEATGHDPQIVLDKPLNIPIRDITHVKVRAKTNIKELGLSEATMSLYYQTEEGFHYWTEDQGTYQATFYATDEFQDSYFKMTVSPNWHGTLTTLRIDPSNITVAQGVEDFEFEIESVELLGPENPRTPIFVEGEKLDTFQLEPAVHNGVTYIPVWPTKGIQDKFKALMVWDNPTKTITATRGNAKVVFTMGKDTALVNGEEVKLPVAPYQIDGLPMVPLRILVEALGADVKFDAQNNEIHIAVKEDAEEAAEAKKNELILATRVPHQWEFNIAGDMEDWIAHEAIFDRAKVRSGSLYLKGRIDDMLIQQNNLNMPAEKCIFKIRMKNLTSNQNFAVFFASSESANFADNQISFTISAQDEDFKEYEFDLSAHKNWKGTISSLRVDPVSKAGVVEIDYIRMESN